LGFSLGGLIAQRFALDHPQRLMRVGLISAIAGRTPEEKEHALRRADELREGGGAASHLGHAVTRWFTDAFREAHPDVVEGRKQRILANHPQCYAAAYRVLAAYDLADELTQIQHETLVATGEFDQGSNTRMSRFMAERIPHAQLRILPGMKHALLLECPDRLADLIRSFVLTGKASTTGYITA
jgi:(E)-2-((N-methylformamido)methylene)succinate hydrolase